MKTNDHKKQIKHYLNEDLDSTDSIGDYLPVIDQLQQWSTPPISQERTDALIMQLAHELPSQQSKWERFIELYPIAILRSQLKVVKREIWIASVLMTIIGLLVTLIFYQSETWELSLAPIAILAPVIAAIGTGLIYDGDLERILELESATRTSKHIILLARLTLVYGFNLGLSLCASGLLAITQSDISLLPLVNSWFVPMTFLSALAFFVSIVSGDAILGWSTNIGIWILHVVFSNDLANSNPFVQYLSLQGLSAPQFHPWLLLMAIILVGVAFWFTEQVERNVGELT